MRILGVDPGSSVTGYGVVDHSGGRAVHVAHGTLRPPRGDALPLRLAEIQRGLAEVVAVHRPEVAVVEEIFVAASPRSALVLGQARGVALATLAAAGLPVVEYSARQIKQASTGSGAARKRDVQAMVRRLLGLETTPAADAADALAAALCHANDAPLASWRATPRRRRTRRTSFVLQRGPR